jgi:hypothetical protein
VLPAELITEYAPPVNLQSEFGPLITGTGCGMKVILRETVESQPDAFVWVTVIVPEAAKPQIIFTVLEFAEPEIVPFVTLQL